MKDSVKNFVHDYPEWNFLENHLIAEWELQHFAAVQNLVDAIMKEANELNHHPTVTFGYNTVKVVTTTHDAGNSVSELDLELAKRISQRVGG